MFTKRDLPRENVDHKFCLAYVKGCVRDKFRVVLFVMLLVLYTDVYLCIRSVVCVISYLPNTPTRTVPAVNTNT